MEGFLRSTRPTLSLLVCLLSGCQWATQEGRSALAPGVMLREYPPPVDGQGDKGGFVTISSGTLCTMLCHKSAIDWQYDRVNGELPVHGTRPYLYKCPLRERRTARQTSSSSFRRSTSGPSPRPNEGTGRRQAQCLHLLNRCHLLRVLSPARPRPGDHLRDTANPKYVSYSDENLDEWLAVFVVSSDQSFSYMELTCMILTVL